MIMSAIGSSASSTGVSELSTSNSNVLAKDDFLNLLITQLQHQDPLNPTDSVEFTAQLAQFSSLEQLGNVNDNLLELQNFQASINNAQAVTLIGKNITAEGNFIQLSGGGSVECNFDLEEDADQVAVSIYDNTGEFVRDFVSEGMRAGQHSLFWDGFDSQGNRMSPGPYTFEVSASSATNQRIATRSLTTGTVTAVSFDDNTAYLSVGTRKVALNDIVDVHLPPGSSKMQDKQLAPAGANDNNLTINGGR
ncbi:Flagellar basal-body rod modification protein FlgD [Olavius algarvensis Delta 1 endosymbiont]|nr:Flagellar basal-body rod modification protein FlgD [Olavius algarvensis Delta 1 endosymbiont]